MDDRELSQRLERLEELLQEIYDRFIAGEEAEEEKKDGEVTHVNIKKKKPEGEEDED